MNIRTGFSVLALSATLIQPAAVDAALHPASQDSPAASVQAWFARGGGGRGGGGRGGGGGARSGGSRSGGDRMRGQTGFQGGGSSLNRGDRRPSGGWSNSVQSAGARPSLDRPAGRDLSGTPGRGGNTGLNRGADRSPAREAGSGLNRATGNRELTGVERDRSSLSRDTTNRGELQRNGTRDFSRDGSREFNRDLNRDVNRDVNRDFNRNVNRNWTRNVNIGDVDIHPGWARPGWGVARPWNWGWYGGWNNPPWGWWGARAAVWGIGTLATASVINSAVDAAINDQVSYIVVPNSSYQLLYGSVAPTGSASVSFAVTADGSTYQLTADCQSGTINGQDPATAAEAELLNAACQVAYGNG